jgi:hypothetical protein
VNLSVAVSAHHDTLLHFSIRLGVQPILYEFAYVLLIWVVAVDVVKVNARGVVFSTALTFQSSFEIPPFLLLLYLVRTIPLHALFAVLFVILFTVLFVARTHGCGL